MATHRQDLNERAFKLASQVFKLCPKLSAAGAGHAYIAKQLLRATASIGANLEEGTAPSSRRDMAEKYAIALRESREAKYWSRLLATDQAWAALVQPITQETGEFVAMLTVSVRKLRRPAEESQPLHVRTRRRRSGAKLSRPRRR
jgi:four helix bundle protein